MNICVYGAASPIIDKKFIEVGEALGRLLGERGHTLIFGGGNSGLMGAVVRGISEKGGSLCLTTLGNFGIVAVENIRRQRHASSQLF